MGYQPFESSALYVKVGNKGPFTDDSNIQVRGDSYGNMMVQSFGGKYMELTRRGVLYMCTVTAGAALLISATTGLHPTIWNPAGSNVVVYPVAVECSFLSGTTTVSSLLWALTSDAGSAIGTAAPIVTFTNVAPRNCLLGSGNVAKFKFAPATVTFTAAPTVIAATGINLGAAAPTAGAPSPWEMDGKIGIMPGTALSLTCAVTSTTSLWFTTIYVAEMPLITGM
jgi:hypothetical protein